MTVQSDWQLPCRNYFFERGKTEWILPETRQIAKKAHGSVVSSFASPNPGHPKDEELKCYKRQPQDDFAWIQEEARKVQNEKQWERTMIICRYSLLMEGGAGCLL